MQSYSYRNEANNGDEGEKATSEYVNDFLEWSESCEILFFCIMGHQKFLACHFQVTGRNPPLVEGFAHHSLDTICTLTLYSTW